MNASEKQQHNDLIARIVDIEHEMFQAVHEERPSLCKDNPKAFKVMRQMAHSPLSNKTLNAYLAHLEQAAADNRNLMTEKYARMENMIPRLKDTPLIERIVEIERHWQEELASDYPQLSRAQSLNAFEVYLHSELETYSDSTLELYFRDASQAAEEGKSFAQERYAFLAEALGYDSLHEWVESLS